MSGREVKVESNPCRGNRGLTLTIAEDEHQQAHIVRKLVQRYGRFVACRSEREQVDFTAFHSLRLVATPGEHGTLFRGRGTQPR